jgi:hypothetical protein
MTTALLDVCRTDLIDDYLVAFDVTDSLVTAVEWDGENGALEGLALLDLGTPVTRTLGSFGIADRLALAPVLLAATPCQELVFGMVWRIEEPASEQTIEPSAFVAFDDPGYLKVIWDVRLRPADGGRAFLSTTTRLVATDEVMRARLLAGWGVTGRLFESLSRQTLAAVKAYADDRQELGSNDASTACAGLACAV